MSYRAIVLLFFEKIIVLSIAFENHRKSLIQQRVHIQKNTNIVFKKPKLAVKQCYHLPDRSILVGKDKFKKVKCVIVGFFQTMFISAISAMSTASTAGTYKHIIYHNHSNDPTQGPTQKH